MMTVSTPPVASHRRAVLLSILLAAAAASTSIYVRTALSPLQEAMSHALSLSDYQVSLIQGPALALPMLLLAAPLGLLVDRQSRVRVLMGLLVLGAAATLASAWASGFAALLAARIAAAVVAPGVAIAAASYLADLVPPDQRGRANMVVAMGQVGGMSAAFASGGVLLVHFGGGDAAWRMALAWMALPVALVSLLLLVLREPPRSGTSTERASFAQALRLLWRARGVVASLTTGVALVAMADGAGLIWGAPTLIRRFGMPADQVGSALAAIILVSGLIGPLFGGLLTDWCQKTGGSRRVISMLTLLALAGAPAGLFAVAPSATSVLVLMCAFLIVGAAINVAVTALVTTVLPNEVRGLCMSAVWTAGAVMGLGVAPVAVSLISPMAGSGGLPAALALTCVATSLLGMAVFALGRTQFRGLDRAASPATPLSAR